jgi:hypothetical protein
MDKQTRQERLQQKLQQLKQRQQTQYAQQVLATVGIPAESCTVHLPESESTQACVAWLNALPWAGTQIDWSQIPGSVCCDWHTYEQAAEQFTQVCQRQQLGNSLVNLVWFNAANPTLQLSLDWVQQRAASLFAHDWDTWIINRTVGWCIECYHEGTLCYGDCSRLILPTPPA